ncbi:hypothetical protein ACNKHP_06080 [Shigella boydii]
MESSPIEPPQEGYAIIMETTPPAPCYFIFVTDPALIKDMRFDFSVLKPMAIRRMIIITGRGNLIALAQGNQQLRDVVAGRVAVIN